MLGGGLSYLVQYSTQRMSARIEQSKQNVARAEARRAERLAHLERFIAVAAEAERIAFERPADWAPGEPWPTAAQEVMHRLWNALYAELDEVRGAFLATTRAALDS